MKNHSIISQAFKEVRDVLAPYIAQTMQKVYRHDWWQNGVMSVLYEDQKRDLPEDGSYSELVDSLDIQRCLQLIDFNWNEIFRNVLSRDHRNWVKELMGIRNRWAHIGGDDFSDSDTARALDTMARLLADLDSETAELLQNEKTRVQYEALGINREELETDDSAPETVSNLPDEDEIDATSSEYQTMIKTDTSVRSFEPHAVDEEMLDKLLHSFPGKIVRKDLTKKIKEGANVPVYVLEYLLGLYCNTTDEDEIAAGVQTVKQILAKNYVRPDEAQKVISKIRELGSYTVIDNVSVKLNYRQDRYEADFSNLGLKGVPISAEYPKKYERLLSGGIWCILQMEYYYDEADPKRNPFIIRKLTPVQMANIDIDDFKDARQHFTTAEWIDLILRSTGMEPTKFNERIKWLHLARLIPLVENNYNYCELGPRSTGKSHIYKEISPNSILISGGQTTVANLFYNMATKQVGLVGLWDCVAFDEVAGIRFKDHDGVQIMKDYMASGSFSRGKESKNASASMVFIGNINQSIDVLLKTSSLFDPFPEEMSQDTAFLDRFHCYLSGWEIPKYNPDFFTNDYGLISDYLAELLREMRKISYADAYEPYFHLGSQLNQRDTIAVKKTVSGMVKLLYPDGCFDKQDIEQILRFALEMRRRVKEQMKKIGGMEFYDVNFSYIDKESFNEEFVPVPEQSGGSIIPEGPVKPGHLYTASRGKSEMIGIYKLETQITAGTGKFDRTGIGSSSDAKEAMNSAFKYLHANSKSISNSISTTNNDYLINVQDLYGVGMTSSLMLPTLIALCSAALHKPVLSSMAILGDLSIGGTLIKVDELANTLQVCLDAGAKKVLIPMTSAADLSTAPAELIGAFNILFYNSAEDAVFKSLGVE